MTRRRKRGQHDDHQGKGSKPTFHVSLDQWQKFQRFLNCEDQIEEAISDLRRAWDEHVALIWNEYQGDIESEDIEDHFLRLTDLMRAVNFESKNYSKKKNNNTRYQGDYSIYPPVNTGYIGIVNPSKNKKIRVATIVIEDISDGNL